MRVAHGLSRGPVDFERYARGVGSYGGASEVSRAYSAQPARAHPKRLAPVRVWGGWDEHNKRYVNDAEKAEQMAARRGDFEVAPRTTSAPEAMPPRCTRRFEAYGARCLSLASCPQGAPCAREWARELSVLRAREAVNALVRL
jgi:hypothetical protein